MEYVAIVGFVLLVMIVAVVILQTRGRSTVDQLVGAQLTSIGQKVVDAAETVYYLGPPSTVTVRASIPQEIDSITIEPREIVFTFRVSKGTSDIAIPSPVNLTGSILATAGIHDITLVSRGTSVEIG